MVPRHVSFYRRVLLFEPLGEARSYGSLNGLETVPMRHDLLGGRERYRAKYGEMRSAKNLYRLFYAHDEEPEIVEWLRRERRQMSEEDFRYFFMEQMPIYQQASPEAQRFLDALYLSRGACSALPVFEGSV